MKIFKTIWKGAKAWLITTVAVLAFLLTASLVLTQVLLIRNTFNTIFGGDRMTLVSGNPDEYEYFKPDEECSSKEVTLEKANLLNEEIAKEGMVLLKNDDNALPLIAENEKKVTVFGKNSVNLVYGGSGSGGADTSAARTIYQSLEDAGFTCNPTVKAFYEKNSLSGSGRPENPGMNGVNLESFSTGETPLSSYTGEVRGSYASYGGAAIVVISRIGGEGFDLPRSKNGHYLQLDKNERDMIAHACENFDKVVLVINCATSMELGFLTDKNHPDYHENLKAAIWIASPGMTGINALGKILNGSVNPSGRLVDIYAKDFTKDPTYRNFGNNVGEGNEYRYGSSAAGTASGYYYVYYEEGIYTGYRYYETRGFTDGEQWYKDNVVFPFGYGLSYTNFTWTAEEAAHESGSVLKDSDEITVKVKVKNVGNRAGKDVVQLYYTAPYTSGGIEKAHVVLGDFAKTKLIEPGEEDTVELKLPVSDMASYDYKGQNKHDPDYRGYILEAGDYGVSIRKSSHETTGIEYSYKLDKPYKLDKDSATGNKVENLFDEMSDEMNESYVTLLSRSDWGGVSPDDPAKSVGTWPTSGATKARVKPSAYFRGLRYEKDDSESQPWYSKDTPPYSTKTLSKDDTEVKLYMLRDKEYDDGGEGERMWNTLLDGLTLQEMSLLIGTGNFNTMRIDSIGKPRTTDPDGPAGFTIFMEQSALKTVYGTCFYSSECLVGATFNEERAYDMGRMIGNESLWGNARGDGRPYSGWYAPAVNIHRSPFSGRNWEYYSEDPLLSGRMAAKVINGASDKGVYTYLKHFALNDQETNREGILTWATEQTMREIYFKPFEAAVKEGGTTAMMSSFNRLGSTWAGGDYRLLTRLLRDEWGFRGMVITDFNTNKNYMPADQMIRAGGDLNLCQDIQPSSDYTATQVTAMRRAVRNILYTVSRSNGMNGFGESVVWAYHLPMWIVVLILIDVAVFCGLAVWGVFAVRKAFKKSRPVSDGESTSSNGAKE